VHHVFVSRQVRIECFITCDVEVDMCAQHEDLEQPQQEAVDRRQEQLKGKPHNGPLRPEYPTHSRAMRPPLGRPP
jgi:hypothetical protein